MKRCLLFCLLCPLLGPSSARADQAVWEEMRADLAAAKHGATGRGVLVAIVDRGIDWRHPDFIKPDGTTRIRYLLDMTGQNLCSGGTTPVEYSEAQINAALAGGAAIPSRDAVGHGTVTTGLAAGNGRAAAGGKYRGLAPEADLLIVKVTSEGAPAHGSQPAEAPFQGCYDQALDWLDGKIQALGQPCVALINSGVQWGPMDGTSAVSRKIDAVFGLDRPGRVYVAASGDEGALPTHARATFTPTTDAVFRFEKLNAGYSYLTMWYTGTSVCEVTVTMDSGATTGTVLATQCKDQSNIYVCQYTPGNAFYPWRSNGPDRAVWIRVGTPAGAGAIRVKTRSARNGTVDLYHADLPNMSRLLDNLVPGRLTDYATTRSAVVLGAHVVRNTWTDINGVARSQTSEGLANDLWLHSSGGPTRDGRSPGVDVTAPGHNAFGAYGATSYWTTFRGNLVQDGAGYYGRAGATSASAPLGVGAVALMLQLDPTLTARRVKHIFHNTARADAFTGPVPNNDWGYGKLDVLAALDATAAGAQTMADVARALRVAGGMASPTPAEAQRLNRDANPAIHVTDAARLLRSVIGL